MRADESASNKLRAVVFLRCISSSYEGAVSANEGETRLSPPPQAELCRARSRTHCVGL